MASDWVRSTERTNSQAVNSDSTVPVSSQV